MTEPAARQHYWDALRGALMMLGIPYHLALAFRTGGWIVPARAHSPLLGPVAQVIHLFRMPAFFLVAGYFAALLLARRAPRAWLRGRALRLGVPFLAALILVVPPMNLLGELADKPPPAAIAAWEESTATSGGYWIRHLWFLVVLGYYSLAAAGFAALAPGRARRNLPARLDGALARHPGPALLAGGLAAGAYALGLAALLAWIGPGPAPALEWLRLDEAAGYAPWFAAGWLLARAPATLDRFGRFSAAGPLLAAGGLALALARPDWAPLAGGVAALAGTQLLVAAARRWFDRPSRIVQRLVDAAFVIYLVHLPLVILAVGLSRHLDWPAVPLFALANAAVLALSYAAARIVVRVPLLDLMFNGILPGGRRARSVPAPDGTGPARGD